jgi:hypothetical protein
VVSLAAPVDAAPSPVALELTTDADPKLFVVVVVVVPVTTEPGNGVGATSGGIVGVTEPIEIVEIVDAIVATGCGVISACGLVAPGADCPVDSEDEATVVVLAVVVLAFALDVGSGEATVDDVDDAVEPALELADVDDDPDELPELEPDDVMPPDTDAAPALPPPPTDDSVEAALPPPAELSARA